MFYGHDISYSLRRKKRGWGYWRRGWGYWRRGGDIELQTGEMLVVYYVYCTPVCDARLPR